MLSQKLIETLKKDGFGLSLSANSPKPQAGFRPRGEYIVNRFPVMCLYAYLVAKKAGYNEKLSKSLAVAVATNYAILKKVGLGFYGKTRKEGKKSADWELIDSKSIKKIKSLVFVGCSLLVEDDLVLALAYVRGKQSPFYPDKFDRQVDKIKAVPGYYDRLVKEIKKAIKDENIEDLKWGRTYFRIWKQNRDYWRSWELLEK